MVAILTGVKWNLNMVLTCIFFMARDIEHFFMRIFFSHLDFLEAESHLGYQKAQEGN
jgi:hypothetical protein